MKMMSVGLVVLLLIAPVQVTAKLVPEDEYWDGEDDRQWAPEQVEADIAWDLTDEDTFTNPGSDNIIIAILDTGVRYYQWPNVVADHEDISIESIWSNPDEELGDANDDSAPGVINVDDDNDGGIDFNDPDIRDQDYDEDTIPLWGPDEVVGTEDDDWGDYAYAVKDDDENGYLDDIHGWDFVDNNNYPLDMGFWSNGNPPKLIYHGSFIAGIAAAITNNESGIAGMAQVEIMPIRIIPQSFLEGPGIQGLIDAFQYAIDNGADIISDSNGFLGSPFLDNQVKEAREKGMLWVCSAGNYNAPQISYPGDQPSVIGVGASHCDTISANYHRASYSSYGPDLDLIAPGGESGEDGLFSVNGSTTDDYLWGSGTSYATPMVAGLVGLMMTYRPSFSPDRLFQILNATCVDITDEAGPKKDLDSDYGKDDYTGWGEINASKAVGYTNYMRNRWSDGDALRLNYVVTGEEKQPSIAVDSEGYSHIVWIDDSNQRNEVWYCSVDAAGRIACSPKTLEQFGLSNPSKYPDIYVNRTDQVHVCWLEEIDSGRDDIYYCALDATGTIITNPTQVTSNDKEKEYLNILTDTGPDPVPTIIFAEDDGADWDIWKVTYIKDVGWPNPTAVVSDDTKDQRKPSADIGEYQGLDYIYFTYQEAGPSDDWEIWMWTDYTNPASNWQITNDDKDDINPNLCMVHQTLQVYVVWTKKDVYESRDKIFLCAIDGTTQNHQTITYGSPTDSTNTVIQVGDDSLASPYDNKAFPKVSVSEISKSHGREDAVNLYQVNVIWREYSLEKQEWCVFISELTSDGRSLIEDIQAFLFVCEEGHPQITASQLRYSLRDDWLDTDGNFRLLFISSYLGIKKLWFASTRERWKDTFLVGNNNRPQINPHVDIDPWNGLHVVYEYRENNKGRIYYRYWQNDSRPPAASTTGPIPISNGDHDCVEPRVTTIITDDNKVKAIVIYKDMSLQSGTGELWFQKIDATTGSSDGSNQLGCTVADEKVEYEHEVANDYENKRIGIVWYEDQGARNDDIHFGVVNYTNVQIKQETHGTVQGTVNDDIEPDIDVDTVGDFHIVYQRAGTQNIYYNIADKSYLNYDRKYSNDKHIDDTSVALASMKPSIRIDRDINRRDNNTGDQDDLSKTHRFIHITYCRKQLHNTRYMLWYTKLDNVANVVVKEKDVTTMASDRDYYYSDVEIMSDLALNSDNQLAVVYHGKMHHGPHWQGKEDWYSVFFTKLDNNGEILTVETYIGDNPSLDSQNPAVDYDNNDRLSVVWQKNTANGWEVRHCWEKEMLK